jgi:hypothetical protein
MDLLEPVPWSLRWPTESSFGDIFAKWSNLTISTRLALVSLSRVHGGGKRRPRSRLGTPKHRDYFLFQTGAWSLTCPMVPQVERLAEKTLAMP